MVRPGWCRVRVRGARASGDGAGDCLSNRKKGEQPFLALRGSKRY
jgi:hypothetical protein